MKFKNFAEYMTERLIPRRTAANLARAIGIAPGNFSHYKTGVMKPTADNVVEIALYFNDDPIELLRLAGHTEMASKYMAKSLAPEEVARFQVRALNIPIIGSAARGMATMPEIPTAEADSPSQDYETLQYKQIALGYAIRIQDTSLEPAIANGSILVIDPGQSLIQRNFALIRLSDGKTLIRRVSRNDGIYSLIAPNPEYPPLYLKRDEFAFIHQVAWVKLA